MARLRERLRLFGQFVGFARESRAYWIIPLVVLFAIVAFVIVAGDAAAPLLYTLF